MHAKATCSFRAGRELISRHSQDIFWELVFLCNLSIHVLKQLGVENTSWKHVLLVFVASLAF